MSVINPTTFHLKLGTLLGEGRYGKVYSLAQYPDRAIKIVLNDDDGLYNINEIAFMRKFKHPHLVRSEDFYYVSQTRTGIILPLAEGTLHNRLRHGVVFDSSRQTWINELYSAVHFIHSHGYQHGDIKPNNILLFKDHVLLSDFSLSGMYHLCKHECQSDPCKSPQLLQKYASCTFDDHVPTDSNGQEDDVWALGVTCYFIHTGIFLFSKDICLPTYYAYLRDPVGFLESRLCDLHRYTPEIVSFLVKLMNPIAEERVLHEGKIYTEACILEPARSIPVDHKYFMSICIHISDICRNLTSDTDRMYHVIYNSIDLYYRSKSSLRHKDMLLASVCVYISCKLHDLRIQLHDICILLDNKYLDTEILRVERDIARAIDGAFQGAPILDHLPLYADKDKGIMWIAAHPEEYGKYDAERLATLIKAP